MIRFRFCIIVRNITEVMLGSSCLILSGGSLFLFISSLITITLIILLKLTPQTGRLPQPTVCVHFSSCSGSLPTLNQPCTQCLLQPGLFHLTSGFRTEFLGKARGEGKARQSKRRGRDLFDFLDSILSQLLINEVKCNIQISAFWFDI